MAMLRLLWSFLLRDIRTELSYRMAFLFNLSGIFFGAFTYFFLSKLIGDQVAPLLEAYNSDYFSFVIIGIAFLVQLRRKKFKFVCGLLPGGC